MILNLSALSGPMKPIGCNISVDGTTIVEQAPQVTGSAFCMKNYTPPE